MIWDLAYLAFGFAVTFLALEVAWNFTACKVKDKTINLFLQRNWAGIIINPNGLKDAMAYQ